MTGPDADGYTVVTGGAGFLGSAVTGRLLADGQRVVVLDRETPARPEAHAFQVDLADEAALERVLGRLLEERGAPGALALCHGWSPKGADGSRIPETDVPADLFRQVIDANLTSCFVLLRTLVPAMAAAGTGRVVAIGSAAAHTGRTTAGSAYAAAKAGVAALVRTFGARYAPQGVLINDVSPGKIANPNWPDSPRPSPDTGKRYPWAGWPRPVKWPTPSPSCCPTATPTSPDRR